MALNVPSLQQLASTLPKEVQSALRSALSAQDKYNRDASQAVANMSKWNWVSPQLTNGWTTGNPPFRFTQLQTGQVVFNGKIVKGNVGSAAFTLPAQIRPTHEVAYAANSGAALGIIIVDAAGTVRPILCPGADISMDFTFLGGA